MLRTVRVTSALLVILAIGCGGGIEGTYLPPGPNAFLDQMTFVGGGKVLLTRWGQTMEGSYTQKGREITIVNQGQTVSLLLENNGCLEHVLMGSFCKGSAKAAAAGGASGGGIEGTWRAAVAGDAIQLEFRSGCVVQVSFSEGGRQSESQQGSWESTSGGVRLQAPNGPVLELVRRGNQLEGNMGGTMVTFSKQ